MLFIMHFYDFHFNWIMICNNLQTNAINTIQAHPQCAKMYLYFAQQNIHKAEILY